jgi:MoaA/NifB/PqqE/SkfB family radical SAM enzyme
MTYAKKIRPHESRIWRGRRPLLAQLDIELTERCDNDCVHCCINLPEDDPEARRREMGTEFVKEILTQAAGLGCLTVRFTGGEPLLREDLAELYVFARRLGMRVILFTNGRRITPEWAALLARIPPGRVVEVSVYGMRPGSCDRAAGKKGAFAEFRRGVALLEEHRIPFIVKAPLLPFLRDEREEFEGWARTIPGMDKQPGYAMNFDLRHRRDDPGKNARIAKLRASPEETVNMLSRNPLYLRDMRQFCVKFMGPPGDKLFSCGAGHGTCIDAYGKAQMCLPLRDPGTGVDLLPSATGLRYALTEFFPGLRERRTANPEYLRRCARCFLKGLCEQCPAKSCTEHGTLDTPVEYLCVVAHAQARHLGLVKDREMAWEVTNWRERVDRFAGAMAAE